MLVQIRAHDQLVPPVAEGGQDWGLKCQRNVLREAVISTGTAKESPQQRQGPDEGRRAVREREDEDGGKAARPVLCCQMCDQPETVLPPGGAAPGGSL